MNVYNRNYVGTLQHWWTARGHVFAIIEYHRPLSAGGPHPTGKLNSAECIKGYFCGGRNTIKLITYKYKIVIPRKLQKYVVKWYHTYILHPVLDRTEAMIWQHLYWPGIREAVHKENNRYDVCQLTKRSTKKTVNCQPICQKEHRGINYV